eukprot:m.88491 g.88491  ORF g.88491 m.88491 type:complete len:285 (-) comp12268_c1_seq1:2648-3502(-)
MHAFFTFTIIAAIVATVAAVPTAPCALIDVGNSDACDAICTLSGSTGSFSASGPSCSCDGTTICSGTDYAPYALYLLENAAGASQECLDLIGDAISNTLIGCFIDGGANMVANVSDVEYFNSQSCDDSCVGSVFSAARTLFSGDLGATCSVYLQAFNVDFEDIYSGLPFAEVFCAEGGMGYCGDIGQFVFDFFENGTPLTANNCNAINNYGKCLGNYRAFATEQLNSTVADQITAGIEASCNMQGVDVTSASSGTEAPADVSSGSLIFGSFFALLAAALVSLLF